MRNRCHTTPLKELLKASRTRECTYVIRIYFLCFFTNAVRVPKAGLETTRETLTPILKQLRQSFPLLGNVQVSSFSEINKLKEKKIFVARNPIDRLLSCWHDKLVNIKTDLDVEETCQHCGVCLQKKQQTVWILYVNFNLFHLAHRIWSDDGENDSTECN